MARVLVNKAKMERLLAGTNSQVERELERRARKVLAKAKELAPKDTGAFADSLAVEKSVERGKTVFRIVSDHPRFKQIVGGTEGPYEAAPPWGPGSDLGGWGSRHGFVSAKSRYFLARKIAVHGTRPAGEFRGLSNVRAGEQNTWITQALREAER